MSIRRAAELAKGITGTLLGRKPDKEEEYLYRCKRCGQMVDERQLGEVLHHEIPNHRPIPTN